MEHKPRAERAISVKITDKTITAGYDQLGTLKFWTVIYSDCLKFELTG